MSAIAVDLATRINEHHRLAHRDAVSALEHARMAGELLLKARAACRHGDWLPWLEAHVDVSPRQAQKYMRLARRWAEIKCEPGADLPGTLRGALELLSDDAEKDAQDVWADPWAWAERHMNAPIDSLDLADPDLLRAKVLKRIGVDAAVAILLDLTFDSDFAEVELLRMCGADGLLQAWHLVFRDEPIAGLELAPLPDIASTMRAITEIAATRMRLSWRLAAELKRRSRRGEIAETEPGVWDETHAAFMTICERRVAEADRKLAAIQCVDHNAEVRP